MIYLLDTNICLLHLRSHAAFDVIEARFDPFGRGNEPVLSAVNVGELKSLARQNNWGQSRMNKLTTFLNQVVVVDINQKDILDCYADIDAFSQGRLEGRSVDFSARNMGKNDLWIAATASVLDATLLTTDRDFDHLNTAFLKLERLSLAEMGV